MDTIMGTSTLEEIWEATEKAEKCSKRSVDCQNEAVVSVLWKGCSHCPKRRNYCLEHFVQFSYDSKGEPFKGGDRHAFCSDCRFVLTMVSYYQIKR